MCVRREHFEKTVFRWVHEGETKLARFVFAMRRPYVVGFLGAVAKAGAPAGGASSSLSGPYVPVGGHLFDIKIGDWMFSDEQFVHEKAEVSVEVEVECMGGASQITRTDWQPWRQYLESFPPLAVQPQEAECTRCPSFA